MPRRVLRRRGAHAPLPTPHSPLGCSLVELLVALVLIGIGVLALAGGVALQIRDVSAAEAEVRAVAVARARVERLAASPCSAVQGGSAALPGGTVEQWSVSRGGPGVLLLVDSVRYAVAGGAHTVAVQGSAPC